MVNVAVAGGTGGVGKTFVDVLQATQHQVLVLGRSPASSFNAAPNTKYVQVSYEDGDIAALTTILREHEIETVISAIGISSDETSRAQLNLIKAAIDAPVTKRFIPSEYGYVNVPELLALDPSVQRWIDAAELLKASRLEYTRFVCGFFMDYWGMPHVKTNLYPFAWGVELNSKRAAIPGDGNAILSLTKSTDLAEGIVRSLDLEQWGEWSVVVGEDISFNEFLRLAERVRGSKFEVTYDMDEDLRNGKVTVLPLPGSGEVKTDEGTRDYLTLFGRLYCNGKLHMPAEHRVAEKIPGFKPVGLEEFLREAWNDK